METTDIIAELRKHGLSNGGSLGWHSGLCDEAADRLEELSEAVKQAEAQIDKLLGELIDREPVVHAHWVTDPKNRPHPWCSACVTTSYTKHLYCPHCGAHMDEEVADA